MGSWQRRSLSRVCCRMELVLFGHTNVAVNIFGVVMPQWRRSADEAPFDVSDVNVGEAG